MNGNLPNRLTRERGLNRSAALNYARNTVTIGPSGAAWPFVPHKQTGTLFFEYCPANNSVLWNSGNSLDVLGMSEAAISSHGAIFLAHVHSIDRFRIESLLESALQGDTPYVATYRWIRPDTAEIRYIHIRALLEPDGSILRGMLVDISSEVVGIQNDPDLTTSAGSSFNMLGIDGVVLDLEFRIRSIFAHHDNLALTFGLSDADTERILVGRNLLECFSSTTSQEHVHRILEQALDTPGEEFVVEWQETRASIRTLLRDGVPSGIGISLLNVAYEQELARENKALLVRVNQLTASPEHISEIANLSQEIVGYAALIKRQSGGNRLLQEAVDALVMSTRDLGERTRKLVTLHTSIADTLSKEHAHTATESVEGPLHGIEGAQILFSSLKELPCSALPSLLEDVGIASIVCSLDEHEIRAQLLQYDFVRIAVLDVPSRDFRTAPLIRSLRRLFPALHFVCLVPGPASSFSDIQRAGAFWLLPKPITSQELEKVLKGLLEISVATIS